MIRILTLRIVLASLAAGAAGLVIMIAPHSDGGGIGVKLNAM
jgi:hypothetical protein